MRKNGFTLIELLAILVVLGVITIVAVPSAINSSREAKKRDLEKFKESICNAAEIYIETHPDDFATLKAIPGTKKTITIGTLIDEGDLSGSTVNPKTNKTIDEDDEKEIIIENDDGELQCEFQE